MLRGGHRTGWKTTLSRPYVDILHNFRFARRSHEGELYRRGIWPRCAVRETTSRPGYNVVFSLPTAAASQDWRIRVIKGRTQTVITGVSIVVVRNTLVIVPNSLQSGKIASISSPKIRLTGKGQPDAHRLLPTRRPGRLRR